MEPVTQKFCKVFTVAIRSTRRCSSFETEGCDPTVSGSVTVLGWLLWLLLQMKLWGLWQVIEQFKKKKKGKNFSNQACAQANSQSFVVIKG